MRNAVTASYDVHESYTVETQDHQDHTFAGVMFDVQVRNELPVDFIEIETIWVRGALGPLTVWSSPGGYRGKHGDQDQWELLYEREHEPSVKDLQPLHLKHPIRLRPGDPRLGLYVHSAAPTDESIGTQLICDTARLHVR
jgi:hypothetical protein